MKKFLYTLLMLAAMTPAVLLAKGKMEFGDLETAIQQASGEHKLIFITYGREACGNCQALHEMLGKKQVNVSKSSYVITDLNCDDPATSKAFRQRYKVDGNTLPFVVIANADGTMLSSRTGYGTAKEFNDFIREAKKLARNAEKAAADKK